MRRLGGVTKRTSPFIGTFSKFRESFKEYITPDKPSLPPQQTSPLLTPDPFLLTRFRRPVPLPAPPLTLTRHYTVYNI